MGFWNPKFKLGTCDYENKYVAWYERNWIYISIGGFGFVIALYMIGEAVN